jgi:reactive chlorine resistance protein C
MVIEMDLGQRQIQRSRVQLSGELILRYGLVIVMGWIGAMKFTAYEAAGIQPLVESSPLMSWLYRFLSLQATSNLIGTVEIFAAILIALRPVSAKLTVLGSTLAVLTFCATLSFLFTLPGWESSLGGFPALSGGFLLKDVVLLGASLWSLGESLTAMQQQR